MATTQRDPRVTRTRRMLQEALWEIARERPLAEVTIAEIADRADVNRSTFYQHYSDKETLLADALDAQAAAAGADLGSVDAALSPGAGSAPPELILLYTRHVHEHLALYREALGEHGSPIAVARLRQRLTAVTMSGFERYGQSEADLGMPAEIAAASIAGSLLGMLTAWLDSEQMAPPEQAAAWIWNALSRPRC